MNEKIKISKGVRFFITVLLIVIAFLIGFWVCSIFYIKSDRQIIKKIDNLITGCEQTLSVIQDWEKE